MGGYNSRSVASMSRKRPSEVATASNPKRRTVTVATVEKWKRENDKGISTCTWVNYERSDANRDHVTSISCSVCSSFQDQLRGMRNFTPVYIDGSTNLRVSSLKDHAATDMHKKAMTLLKKKQGKDPCEYSPIVRAFVYHG